MAFSLVTYMVAFMAYLASPVSTHQHIKEMDVKNQCRGDVEYTFVDQKKNWSEAELHCKSLGHGFTLAIVDSDATRDAIAAVAQDHVWIGLKESADKTWWTVHGRKNKYDGWDAEQPNPWVLGDEEETRAIMLFPSKKWHDFPPKSRFKFVCQSKGAMRIDVTGSCNNKNKHELKWMLIQRSVAPYNRASKFWTGQWNDFKDGFRSEDLDYWMGLERMHQLTSTGKWELILRVRYHVATNVPVNKWRQYDSMNPKFAYVIYGDFKIENEKNNYTLRIGERKEHKDAPSHFLEPSNGQPFATKDNPGIFRTCFDFGRGWWFSKIQGFSDKFPSHKLPTFIHLQCYCICMTCDLIAADQTREINEGLTNGDRDQPIHTMMAMRRIN